MNSISPELNWKPVTKGRRTRKAVARNFKGVSKEGVISPKRVGDFSGSDTDKLAGKNPEQPSASKSDHVPFKKRRRLPRTTSPKPTSSSPSSEGQDRLLRSNYSSFTKLQLEGIDELAKAKSGKRFSDGTLIKQAEEEYTGDFSGIELLAAAASMEDSTDNDVNKEDHAVEDHSIRGSPDTSTAVTPADIALKANESGKSSSTTTLCGDSANCLPVLNKCTATSQSSSGIMNVATSPTCISSKVDRKFWDLNTDMDAWGVPVDGAVPVEELKGSEDDKISNPVVVGVASSILKTEETSEATPDRTSSCTVSTGLQEHLLKPVQNSDPNVGGDTSNQATVEGIDNNCSNTVICGDADMIKQDVKMPDAEVSASQFALGKDAKDSRKSIESLGNATSLMNSVGFTTCKREYGDDEVKGFTSVSKSESFLAAGTCMKDEKCVEVSDSKVQNDEAYIAGSTKAESHSQQDELLAKDKLVAKHENNGLPIEGSGRTMLEDSCNSYSARAQYGCHINTAGKMDVDARPESPYEDGELRLSFSWEENELEAECVDYESDGRKGEDSDAADNLGSDVVEGGCEGLHGNEGRISMMKRSLAGNREKSDLDKHPLRRNFSRDEYKNVEACGKKESDGGSGTTVEQGVEMVLYENSNDARNRDMTRRTDADDIKGLMGEYASRMVQGKLQSRVGGRSPLEAADAKDFFSNQYRPRRISGFRERDGSPEKYVGRYKQPAPFRNERDGVDQWSNWGSKRRFNTPHHETMEDRSGPRPRRNFTGEVADKYDGLDFHDQRQPGEYLSRGGQRHIVRTRSPVDRDADFDTHKREFPARRFTNFRGRGRGRGRGYYPQSGRRDFGDDYEPRPNSGAAPARFSRMPRREQSFSPDPVRDAHVPFSRRRSRSRSKSRSPRPWHSYKDGNFNRRPSGSPEFRSEARVERIRAPFHKSNFTSEYREGYMSPQRGRRFSPQRNTRNTRWVDGPSFGENNFKRRRSPTGVFRGTNQSFNSSGRVKSDEYFRPMIRPRRPSFMDNDGRESKFENNYDDRKLEDREEMRRGKPHEDGGNFRRFQHDVTNDFETNISNNEEGIRRPAPVELPQVQCDREEKEFDT